MGPVQIVVLEMEGEPHGELLAAFDDLSEAVRLVDFLVVRRSGDEFDPVDVPGRENEGDAVRALLEGGGDGETMEGGDDVWFLADGIPDGALVAIALIEHKWAERLRAANESVGGTVLLEEWIDHSDVEAAGIS